MRAKRPAQVQDVYRFSGIIVEHIVPIEPHWFEPKPGFHSDWTLVLVVEQKDKRWMD